MAQVTPLVLLSELQDELTGGSGNTSAEARKRRLIEQASLRLQDFTERRFDEYIDTRYFSSYSAKYEGDVDGQELILDADLRSVTTITNGDSTTVSSSNYMLLPRNTSYKRRIRLNQTSGIYWTSGNNDPKGVISVEGKWGFGGEWLDTGDAVQDNPSISDSVTQITVNDGSNFEVDMTLKIDSEYLLVTAISTNTLTVERAVNGSTAASHLQNADIYRWDAYPLAKEAVIWLVLWRLERVKSRLAGEAFLADAGIPVTVSALPREFQQLVSRLKRHGKHFLGV